ncbi:MAG: hypothetical protein EGQ20_15275 [Bacteroides oleiciplenus]|nr:hypothetical protein [Bacteroides oleiciplenus]
MKTINLMTASLAALLMAGCSQNEVTEISPDTHPQMMFGAYTGTSTRGVDTTNDSMKNDPSAADKYGGFGIMGYFTGSKTWDEVKTSTAPGFMYNQMVKWDGTLNENKGGWTYTPIKYWPNNSNDKISFFAYAPYENNGTSGTKTGVKVCDATTKGIPYIEFTLKEEKDLPKMVDLVVAQKLDQTYASTSSTSNKINFKFDHILSRVSFKAKLGDGNFGDMDGDKSFVYITEMWIVGKNHGTSKADGNLSLLNPAAESNTNSKFYTTAQWKNLRWDYTNAVIPDKDFDLKSMLDTKTSITESNPTTGHSATISGVKIDKNAQTTPVSLFPENQYLYLIPIGEMEEKQDTGCSEGEIKIGFHYDIVTKSETTSGEYIASHAESVISIPIGHLKRKTTYEYTLIINLHAIEIGNAEVTPWGDEVETSPVV